MKKKLKGGLFAKVFFLTALLLLFVSMLTYGLLAWLTPRTYADRLDLALQKRVEAFVLELEKVTFPECGGLFEQMLLDTEVVDMELYNENGVPVAWPGGTAELPGMSAEATGGEYEEAAPLVSDSYFFTFAGSEKRYMLIVYGDGERLGLLYRSFVLVLPALLCVSVLAALLFAFFYAAVIMQLQNANKRLAQDIAQEKALERERLDFFSAVSHELKTPVTVIKGQLEGMLLGIGAYRDRETYLARALEVVNSLEQLVQELLTVLRLEGTGADLRHERFDAVKLIRDYLACTEDFIIKKELQLDCNLPPAAIICGNKILLEKVFTNLLGNALKYAPVGAFIRISAIAGEGWSEFLIENSGTHIPDECLPRLFEAFYRVEQSRNRKLGGSGLGLYIVQKVLALHGSRCEVCNTPAGVQFSFVLEQGDRHRNHT